MNCANINRILFASIIAVLLVASSAIGASLADKSDKTACSDGQTVKAMRPDVQKLMERIEPSVVSIYATKFDKDAAASASSTRRPDFSWFTPDFTGLSAVSFIDEWTTDTGSRRWLGSGLIVDDQGHILVHDSLLKGTSAWEVTTYDGSNYIAERLGTDPRTGLAVMKFRGENLQPLHLGANNDSQKGWWVRKGTPHAKLGIEVADPAAYFNRMFGFRMPVTGVMIMKIDADSPAEKAGLRVGELIISVNGQSIGGVTELFDQFQKHDWSQNLTLEVQNKDATRKVTLKADGK